MKIERVEAIQAGNWLFFQVTTDTGLTGLGEAGLWAFPSAAHGMLGYVERYLVGKDPLAIEHHWQYMYRANHFRGAAVQGALAAIDIALWDIAGKHYQAPVHRLLGGPTRDKIRLYMHILGDTPDALAGAAQQAVEQGYTAVRFDPFRARWPDLRRDAFLRDIAGRVGAVRETIGPDVDICIECHYKLTPADAFEIGRALAPLNILFLEDPLPPENPRQTGEIANRVPVSIATGERLHTSEEFLEVLMAGPVAYLRPDVCLTGLTQGKKIASMAEAFRVGVIPHNWLSPVNTAACVQLAAAIPNFVIQEYTGEDAPPKSRLVKQTIKRDGGFLIVPETPGIGVELDLEFARALPFGPLPIKSRIHEDGSVADD